MLRGFITLYDVININCNVLLRTKTGVTKDSAPPAPPLPPAVLARSYVILPLWNFARARVRRPPPPGSQVWAQATASGCAGAAGNLAGFCAGLYLAAGNLAGFGGGGSGLWWACRGGLRVAWTASGFFLPGAKYIILIYLIYIK